MARRCVGRSTPSTAFHTWSARWAEHNGLVLGQWKVAAKSNEITAVAELLRLLELSGCIVTVDAMGCQKKLAKEIKKANADYVLALKGNQETVHDEVKTFLDAAVTERSANRPVGAKLSAGAAKLAEWETVAKDHGRLETWRYYKSAELDYRSKWEGLKSAGLWKPRGKWAAKRRWRGAIIWGVCGWAGRDHWGGCLRILPA